MEGGYRGDPSMRLVVFSLPTVSLLGPFRMIDTGSK